MAGAAGALHEMFVMVMLASVALHVAGALKHVFVDRDGTLARMWFGPAEAGNGQPHGHSLAAPLLALGVFAAVLVGGAASGELSPRDRRPDAAPALAEVTSDWTVTEGTLGITTTQFGSEVNGQFADWTAAIAFDPDTGTGTTEVTIAIGTLTLGSVTAQALGADYLDAEGHPTALFTAEISEESGGYVAAGELTIKGITLPLDLPFTLEIDGDTATMSGRAQLDRRDYEVGLDQDEANLGFPVFVVIDLVATR